MNPMMAKIAVGLLLSFPLMCQLPTSAKVKRGLLSVWACVTWFMVGVFVLLPSVAVNDMGLFFCFVSPVLAIMVGGMVLTTRICSHCGETLPHYRGFTMPDDCPRCGNRFRDDSRPM